MAECVPLLQQAATVQSPLVVPRGNVGPALPGSRGFLWEKPGL